MFGKQGTDLKEPMVCVHSCLAFESDLKERSKAMTNKEALEILYRWHAEIAEFMQDGNNRPSESPRKDLEEQQ